MTAQSERLHLLLEGATRRELGLQRGEGLRATLGAAYERYAELFRQLGVTEQVEAESVSRSLAAIDRWRPEVIDELEGIAAGAGVELAHVVALNARTEILALGSLASMECSTFTASIAGRRHGVQTWDWHIELAEFWHTQEVAGPGHRYAGLTEQGILSKIGVNSAGLALHFNILRHAEDGPTGVPVHVLSAIVLDECATVDDAIELIREAPIGSSSAFTLLDATQAVSVEMSPAGVFVIPEVAGSVQRTNHFQHEVPLAGQKPEVDESESSERLTLLRDRLDAGLPADTAAMVELLVSGEGQAPLTAIPDMSLQYGERWASLATVVTAPEARTIRILDGMPTDAATRAWRTLTVRTD